ncbi:uncharacterized protein [Panulirus ornatus]|uniref:uncharacterized protein n=1 Tax=Panulirus ornatus TaxID=150431 RepID=UPI003A8A86FB
MGDGFRGNGDYGEVMGHGPRTTAFHLVVFATFFLQVSTTSAFTPVAPENRPTPEIRGRDGLIPVAPENRPTPEIRGRDGLIPVAPENRPTPEIRGRDDLIPVAPENRPTPEIRGRDDLTPVAPENRPTPEIWGRDDLTPVAPENRPTPEIRGRDDLTPVAPENRPTPEIWGRDDLILRGGEEEGEVRGPWLQVLTQEEDHPVRPSSATQQTQQDHHHVRPSSATQQTQQDHHHVRPSSATQQTLGFVHGPHKEMTSLERVREGLLDYIGSRGSEVGRTYSALTFPSLEAALLSLAFLTFAVFLIDLVQDLLTGNSGGGRHGRARQEGGGEVDEGVTDMIVLTLSSLDTLSFGREQPDCGRKLLCHLNRSGWHDGLLGTASNYFVSLLLTIFSPTSGFGGNLEAASSGREEGLECVARYPSCPSILGDLLPTTH